MEYSDDDNLENDILEPEDLFMSDSGNENDENKNENKDQNDKDKTAQEEEVNKTKRKRTVKNRVQVKLNLDTLMGPNGLSALKESFKKFQFKGTNHEKEDLTNMMQILQHWMCYRLFPSSSFENTLALLEHLGNKKNVQTYMKKIRMGTDDWGEQQSTNQIDTVNNEISDKEVQQIKQSNFDLWLQQQIANADSGDDFSDCEITEVGSTTCALTPTPTPAATVSAQVEFTLTPEQLERIARNKKLAEERRMKHLNSDQNVK